MANNTQNTNQFTILVDAADVDKCTGEGWVRVEKRRPRSRICKNVFSEHFCAELREKYPEYRFGSPKYPEEMFEHRIFSGSTLASAIEILAAVHKKAVDPPVDLEHSVDPGVASIARGKYFIILTEHKWSF